MSAISEAAHDEDESLACESEKCHWRHLLTDQMRETLQDANFSAGLATLIIGFWLNCAIIMSEKLRSEKCYRNLLNYTIAATVRRAVPVVCIGYSNLTCDFFGFVDTFIAVYELESLTQVCIERLIYALYIYKGWINPDWHNKLFVSISLFLAFLYSTLPLLGYGSYGKDFDCMNCTFDILLPTKAAYKLIVIVIFVLKNLKPTVVITFSLNFTRWLEVNKIKVNNKNEIVFTLSICIVVLVNIVFWFPIFLVRASVVMAQIVHSNTEMIWSPCFVMWAISMHWISPAVAMIGLIWYNPRVRAKMTNLVSLRPIDSDEPTPPPTPAQPAQDTTPPPAQDTKAIKTN
ncbi:hypothetical protein ABMA28_013730 [Loxostege sticticalis]|uniref:G-protein coupled receptors family 1 profile domain-containing protein n=1 Tax=Loxostege sticticalis TaxID=481309 RepID=A0ABD0TJE3_LOXSC